MYYRKFPMVESSCHEEGDGTIRRCQQMFALLLLHWEK